MRKVWKDVILMGIEESNDVEFLFDGRLNWMEFEVWKEYESMKILESSKDKSRKEKRKEKYDYSFDEERKDGRK